MKKIVSYVALVILIIQCVCTTPYVVDYKYDKTRPVVISDRIGESVDVEERAQYELFVGITDFKSAVFYRIYKAGYKPGYVVEIETESQRLIAVNRDPNAIEILRDFIDRYEEIENDRKAFEKKWGIITYDELGQPITLDELKIAGSGYSYTGLFALGCGLLGIVPSIVIAIMGAGGFSGEINGTVAVLTFIGGMVVSIGSGAYIGSQFDRDKSKSIKRILESRKPKVVEDF